MADKVTVSELQFIPCALGVFTPALVFAAFPLMTSR